MQPQTADVQKSEFVASKPGITLIKSGTPEMVDLEKPYMCPGLKSTIIDIPITDQNAPLAFGRFVLRPSVDLPVPYDYVEVKIIVEGKIVVQDEAGVRYEAEAGDVLVFTPPHTVTFLAESDGVATYAAHRKPEPAFMPPFE